MAKSRKAGTARDCTGECTWVYVGGVDPWAKTGDSCSEGCACFAPTYVARLGTTDTTDCNSDVPAGEG